MVWFGDDGFEDDDDDDDNDDVGLVLEGDWRIPLLERLRGELAEEEDAEEVDEDEALKFAFEDELTGTNPLGPGPVESISIPLVTVLVVGKFAGVDEQPITKREDAEESAIVECE